MELLSALLLSNDARLLGMTNKIFDDYGIHVNLASSSPAAGELIRHKTFDLAVYDNDVPGAMELASENGVRSCPRMVFAMVRNEQVSDTHGKRIHFVVQKPCSYDMFSKSLRAAFGMMLREKRASHRHAVRLTPSSTLVAYKNDERSLDNITVLDISQTGLCLQADVVLPQNAAIKINLIHPKDRELLTLTGIVVWAHASGRTGVRLSGMPSQDQERLQNWLNSLLPGDQDLLPKALAQQQSGRMPIADSNRLFDKVLGAK